jgi:hypothetical protein
VINVPVELQRALAMKLKMAAGKPASKPLIARPQMAVFCGFGNGASGKAAFSARIDSIVGHDRWQTYSERKGADRKARAAKAGYPSVKAMKNAEALARRIKLGLEPGSDAEAVRAA